MTSVSATISSSPGTLFSVLEVLRSSGVKT